MTVTPSLRLRRLGGALAAASALLLAASAVGATTGGAQQPSDTDDPVAIDGTDPVLDEVPVAENKAIANATDDLVVERFRSTQAALRAIDAQRHQRDAATALDDATKVAEGAEARVVASTDELAVQELILAGLQATEDELSDKLAVQQDELRRLAAAVVVSSPTDDYGWLGEPDDLSAATRRDAMRDRSVDTQVRRVRRALEPWQAAVDERRDQDGVVAEARDTLAGATAFRDLAVEVRAQATAALDLAETHLAEQVAAHQDQQNRTDEALVVLRRARLEATVKGQDLRLVALHAYWRASAIAPCRIPWWLLAGVGKVETRHGTAHGSVVDSAGDTTVHILGIPLDGRPGVAAIADTDGGALDADGTWDRAVGPMQFIPGTWRRWAADGNADATADPHNIYDAAAAAANYLCFGRSDLTDPAAARSALLSYNQSVPYGDKVLAGANAYREALGLPDVPEPAPQTTED